MIRLEHGDWCLALRPDLGASITSLTWRGRDILRPATKNADSPLQAGCFPLIPYANRIDRGVFEFGGRRFVLPATPRFYPHAQHGLAWLCAWSVRGTGPDTVDLALAAERCADWPWAWTAEHRMRLDDRGLEATVSLTNEDRRPMPAGLGLHPYFAMTPDTVLTARAAEVWLNGPDQIPLRLARPSAVVDWDAGVALGSAPFVDNAYGGWTGSARLDHGDVSVTITASSNARWLQIYAPRGEAYVCAEPMTHRPNALNAGAFEDAGQVTLEPGQSLVLTMRIAAARRARRA